MAHRTGGIASKTTEFHEFVGRCKLVLSRLFPWLSVSLQSIEEQCASPELYNLQFSVA